MKTINLFINLIFLILLVFGTQPFIFTNKAAFAQSENLEEIQSTNSGLQLFAKANTQKRRSSNKRIASRLMPTKRIIEDSSRKQIYLKDISCEERLYKDSQINGVLNMNSKSGKENVALLMDGAIKEACSNEVI